MNRRWVCPTCGKGKLAPSRLRKIDVRRFCLPCSERTGLLVERVIPSRKKAQEKARDKAKAKAKRKRERERPAREREARQRRARKKIDREQKKANEERAARRRGALVQSDVTVEDLKAQGYQSGRRLWAIRFHDQYGCPIIFSDAHQRPFYAVPKWLAFLDAEAQNADDLVRSLRPFTTWVFQNPGLERAARVMHTTWNGDHAIALLVQACPFPVPSWLKAIGENHDQP